MPQTSLKKAKPPRTKVTLTSVPDSSSSSIRLCRCGGKKVEEVEGRKIYRLNLRLPFSDVRARATHRVCSRWPATSLPTSTKLDPQCHQHRKRIPVHFSSSLSINIQRTTRCRRRNSSIKRNRRNKSHNHRHPLKHPLRNLLLVHPTRIILRMRCKSMLVRNKRKHKLAWRPNVLGRTGH